MIKLNWWLEIWVEILLVFLAVNVIFLACSVEARLSVIGAAFIVLIYEGWKVLND